MWLCGDNVKDEPVPSSVLFLQPSAGLVCIYIYIFKKYIERLLQHLLYVKAHVCCDPHMKEQLSGLGSFLPPCGAGGWNSGSQARLQML